MAKKTIFKFGTATIAVPANNKVAVISTTPCKIYKRTAFANYPATLDLVATTIEDTEYVSAVFSASAATTIVIEAGAGGATYEVSSAPSAATPEGGLKQPTPTAKTVAVTLTAAELLTRIITGTHAAGATQAYTLPTGALTDAAAGLKVDEAFDWCLINLSAAALDTVTLTAATGHTIVGNPIVQSANAATGGVYGNSAVFRTRKTAASTFVTYRLA
jgi:hypothetical protein